MNTVRPGFTTLTIWRTAASGSRAWSRALYVVTTSKWFGANRVPTSSIGAYCVRTRGV